MTDHDLHLNVIRRLLPHLRHRYGKHAPFHEESTHVELDGDRLTITLKGAMNGAERYFANSRTNREFLETLYGRQLSLFMQDFEGYCNTRLGKTSAGMNVMLEPEQGNVTFTLALCDI